MIKPIDLMIVGAQKAATTSLLRCLGMHPRVCIHKQLELTYFVLNEEFALGYEKVFRKYYSDCQDNSSIIMAKNVGIMYWTEAAKRLKNHNPDIHLVVILRNPIDRAYSAYWYARRIGWENLSTFEEAIEAEPHRLKDEPFKWRHCAYLDRSTYCKHLDMLYYFFKREQVHIILFEDFKKNPADVCNVIWTLFDLDSTNILNTDSHHNKASIARSESIAYFLISNNLIKRFFRFILPEEVAFLIKSKIQHFNRKRFTPPPMNPETRARLIEYFKPHNERLSEMLRLDLSQWNK